MFLMKEIKNHFMMFNKMLVFMLSFLVLSAISSLAQDQLCNLHQSSPRGPRVNCDYCHDLPYPGYLKDGVNLIGTAICNACHSPEGQFDGVQDPVIGAKANWESSGVYEGESLRQGKEKWCVTCHDDGDCSINGVPASNIAGLSMSGDWQSPPLVIDSDIPNGDNLIDHDTDTGTGACLIGCNATGLEVIFDLGEAMTLSHLRFYTAPNSSSVWDVFGSQDLVNWNRIMLGQCVMFALPRWGWTTSPTGGWNEARLDRFVPSRYIKLVKINNWPFDEGVLREFEYKRDLQYGYYVTGHKMNCTQCHDVQKTHIDGKSRTYYHVSDPYNEQDPNNYQNGYRLKSVEIDGVLYPPMEIPRIGTNWDIYPRISNDFTLCFSCHDKYSLLGDASSSADFFKPVLQTNFCNQVCLNPDGSIRPECLDPVTGAIKVASLDLNGNVRNQHMVHLQGRGPKGNTADWDSDWDGIHDSPQSCTACHNIHGSPAQAMIRHGELISTPDKNKAPALNLYYLNETGAVDENTELMESIGGKIQFWGGGSGSVTKNGVCRMCHNDNMTYLRTPVEAVSCVACHSRPFASRRQVTGDDGDFILASHHVTDGSGNQVVKDQDCKACHDQTHHTEGTVLLLDVDGGASYAYDPANTATAEAACLSCHDSDLSVPFSDGVIVPDIENGNLWSASAHAVGGNGPIRVTCLGDGVLTGCHSNAHGSQKPSLLSPCQTGEPVEEGICNACHNGQLVVKDIQVPFQKTFRHPVERSGLHTSDENGADLGPENRHAECLDCHNPHAAGASVHTPVGNVICDDSVLKGVFGVEPVISPDLLPGQQIYQFVELKSPNYPQGSTTEYQVCFKCHSYYAFGWADHGVTEIIGPSGDKITDQAMEFSPANRSAHPVVMATSEQTGAYEPKGLEAVQLKDPWKAGAKHQTMYCSDCHGTDMTGTLDAQGPHGSDQRFMLKDITGGTRTYWPERPDGKLWNLNDLRYNKNDWKNKLFCAGCHPLVETSNGGGGLLFLNNVHHKGPHHTKTYVVQGVVYNGAPCIVCHAAVPHGTATSRLIAYSSDVAPYNYHGSSAIIGDFQKTYRNSYLKQSCYVPYPNNWGCHSRGYDSERQYVYDSAAVNPPKLENNLPQITSNSTGGALMLSEPGIFSGTGAYDPDGSISLYQWDFGDGASVSSKNMLTSHAYQNAGTYSVTLTLIDNEGAQATDEVAVITVLPVNKPPIADAGQDQTVCISEVVSFSGARSCDVDGIIMKYRWDFGDGFTAEGIDASHIYDSEGIYYVLLTVTNNHDKHDTDMAIVNVMLP